MTEVRLLTNKANIDARINIIKEKVTTRARRILPCKPGLGVTQCRHQRPPSGRRASNCSFLSRRSWTEQCHKLPVACTVTTEHVSTGDLYYQTAVEVWPYTSFKHLRKAPPCLLQCHSTRTCINCNISQAELHPNRILNVESKGKGKGHPRTGHEGP
jgi:hypothetical protein